MRILLQPILNAEDQFDIEFSGQKVRPVQS